MSETVQVYVGICAIIPSLVYALAYGIGGRDTAPLVRPRLWRRVIAPMLFSLGVIGLSLLSNNFKAGYLLAVPSYVLVHWLGGYGGVNLWVKLLRRSWTGLLSGIASLSFAIFTGSYELFTAQVILAISAHLFLGIRNPIKASYEEVLISFLTVVLVPFMVI